MVAFFRMAAVFRSKASLLEGMAFWKVRTFRLSKTRHAKTVSRRVLNLSHEPISALTVATFFSLEVLTVNGHEKRGAYVGSHLHLNVTYLAQANPDEPLKVKPDENSALKWVPLDDAVRLSSEPWIRDRIYRKLIAKTRAYCR